MDARVMSLTVGPTAGWASYTRRAGDGVLRRRDGAADGRMEMFGKGVCGEFSVRLVGCVMWCGAMCLDDAQRVSRICHAPSRLSHGLARAAFGGGIMFRGVRAMTTGGVQMQMEQKEVRGNHAWNVPALRLTINRNCHPVKHTCMLHRYGTPFQSLPDALQSPPGCDSSRP